MQLSHLKNESVHEEGSKIASLFPRFFSDSIVRCPHSAFNLFLCIAFWFLIVNLCNFFPWRSYYAFSLSFLFHILLFQVFFWTCQDVLLQHELRDLSCAVQTLVPSWFLWKVCLGPAATERRELMYLSSISSTCGAGCVFAFDLFSSILYACIAYHVHILLYMEARIQPSWSTLQTLSVFYWGLFTLTTFRQEAKVIQAFQNSITHSLALSNNNTNNPNSNKGDSPAENSLWTLLCLLSERKKSQ